VHEVEKDNTEKQRFDKSRKSKVKNITLI